MRLALTLALTLTACTTTMNFRVIDHGSYGADAASTAASPAVVAVASDPARYAALWARFVGSAAPEVDFAKESVVFLSLGTRRSGGYAVTPTRVAADGDVAVLTVDVTTPKPGGFVTMAFTAPYAVVAVDCPNLRKARWIDHAGNVVAEVR